jgi:hypothetical protein
VLLLACISIRLDYQKQLRMTQLCRDTTGGWTTHCLPLDAHSFSELKWESTTSARPAGPAFYKAEFDTPKAMDTFLATKGWTKGIACKYLPPFMVQSVYHSFSNMSNLTRDVPVRQG